MEMRKSMFYLSDDVKVILADHAREIQREGEPPNTNLVVRRIVSEWAAGRGRKTPPRGGTSAAPDATRPFRPFLLSSESLRVIDEVAEEIRQDDGGGGRKNKSLALRHIVREWAEGRGRKTRKEKVSK